MDDNRLCVLIHSFTGAGLGLVSPLIGPTRSFGLMILSLLVLGKVTERMVKEKHDRKWWIGNGAVIFILVWLSFYILFYNW